MTDVDGDTDELAQAAVSMGQCLDPLSFEGSVTVHLPCRRRDHQYARRDATARLHHLRPAGAVVSQCADTLPAHQDLVHNHPEQLRELVGSDLGHRIDEFRLSAQWDDIVRRLATEWHVDGSVDINRHRPHWP